MKKAGYRSALVGKWHLGTLPDFGPLQSGYDHFYGFRAGVLDYFTHKYGPPSSDTEDLWEDDVKIRQSGYLTDLLGNRAVDVVDAYAKSGQPFLVSLHFNAPHWPWEAPGDEAESLRLEKLFHFDGGSQRTYRRMIQQVDLQVGRVLQALDPNGAAENTIVVFTATMAASAIPTLGRSPAERPSCWRAACASRRWFAGRPALHRAAFRTR